MCEFNGNRQVSDKRAMVLLISVFLLLAIPMEPQSTVVNITPSSLAARNQQRVEQHTRDSEARCREGMYLLLL